MLSYLNRKHWVRCFPWLKPSGSKSKPDEGRAPKMVLAVHFSRFSLFNTNWWQAVGVISSESLPAALVLCSSFAKDTDGELDWPRASSFRMKEYSCDTWNALESSTSIRTRSVASR
jgi:hypothetical protein